MVIFLPCEGGKVDFTCPDPDRPSCVCSSGYIVFSGPRRANGIQGLRFIIQSEKPPHYLESRVEAFLLTMEKVIEDMTEEAFQKHIQALAIRRLDKPKKLSAECAKYWGEIISQQYNYDRGNVKRAPQWSGCEIWEHQNHSMRYLFRRCLFQHWFGNVVGWHIF